MGFSTPDWGLFPYPVFAIYFFFYQLVAFSYVCARVCVCVQVGLTNIVFIFWLLDAMLLFLCFFASFSFNFFFVLQFFSARGHFI